MNWVWPISPAQAPRISAAVRSPRSMMRSASINSASEGIRSAAIVSQRRQRTDGREFADVDAEIRLQPPDRHQHLAGHAVGLFDSRRAPNHIASSCWLPRVSRGGTMRPENSSKLWLKTSCERSRDNTALSGVTPFRPDASVACEMPLAAASFLKSASQPSKLPVPHDAASRRQGSRHHQRGADR